MSNPIAVPSVSVTYAKDGTSTKANALGMRPMQVYILDGLLNNASEIQPDTIHGDTQAQSATVFALAYLFGHYPDAQNS